MPFFIPEPQRAWKDPVRVVATANVNIAAPGATIDGITMVSGDRVLLTNQTTASENHIWVWNGAAAAMTTPYDALSSFQYGGGGAVVPSGAVTVAVREGTAGASSVWQCTTTGAIVLGTTALAWRRIDDTGSWMTLIQAKGSLAAATVAGTYVLKTDGSALSAVAAVMTAASAFFPLDSAQYAITGRVPQLRLVASVLNNATAPAATFTFHLHSITSIAALIPTLATATGEQTAVVTTPAANAQTWAYGASFSMPATTGQGFALTVVTNATIATGASPLLTCLLQSRAV